MSQFTVGKRACIFRIIYELGAIKDLIALYDDYTDNNTLRLAAKLASSDRLGIVSGAAHQLQRELLWFQVCLKSPREGQKQAGSYKIPQKLQKMCGYGL